MSTGTSVSAIEAMLAPVVMVTSCSIVSNGMLSLYASINDRMRSMTGERLQLARTADATKPGRERITEIDHELPLLLHRHRLMHNALLFVYGAVLLVVASMFLVALSVGDGIGWAGSAALWVLLAATAMLLVALAFTAVVVRRSQDAISYEVHRVLAIDHPDLPST